MRKFVCACVCSSVCVHTCESLCVCVSVRVCSCVVYVCLPVCEGACFFSA